MLVSLNIAIPSGMTVGYVDMFSEADILAVAGLSGMLRVKV